MQIRSGHNGCETEQKVRFHENGPIHSIQIEDYPKG